MPKKDPIPSPIEIQHMICMLLLPMVGNDEVPIGADTKLADHTDSLDNLELVMGLEEFFPALDSDRMDMAKFGPTVADAATCVHRTIRDG
jgi:acyl carrier protein